ncbi:MAG TPA: DUF4347 domain-containing protein [Oculatellaceae cyanobacterium]
MQVDSITNNTQKGILFVDSTVTDYQTLLAGTVLGIEAVVLSPDRDGVEQITEILQKRQNINTIHIVSHGSPACVYLGNIPLNLNTLNKYIPQLQSWTGGTILIYGCNVAAGDAGEEFIAKLQQITGAKIAASATRTGSAAMGGDWQLEKTTKPIAIQLAFEPEILAIYSGVFAPGQLDSSFGGGDGIVTTDFGGYEQARSVAVQSDGKLVVLAYTSNGEVLIRYNPDGTLDTSFGYGTGKVYTGNGSGNAVSVKMQSDGKILTLSNNYNGSNQDLVVTRYNVDGSYDNTFGNYGYGKVTIDFGSNEIAKTLIVQSDGKILVAGDSNGQVIIARYLSSGISDTSFGNNGKVTAVLPSGDVTNYIALQADGKIVAVSSSYNSATSTNDIFLTRINSNGTSDTSFGNYGQVITNLGGFENKVNVAVQADGKIVVAAWSDSGSQPQIGVVRYNSNGTLDNTFGGGDGIVLTPLLSSNASSSTNNLSLAIDGSGRIVVATNTYNNTNDNIIVVRYNSDGNLDTSFDSDGITNNDLGNNSYDRATSLALQSDGNIVVVGSIYQNLNEDIAIVRYLGGVSSGSGQLDASFGGGDGKVTTDFGFYERVEKLAVQSDGKLVVLASTSSGNNLIRYNLDGTIDTSFGGNGSIAYIGSNSIASGVAVQSDGKILFLGSNNTGGNQDIVLERYNSNGSIDTTFGNNGKLLSDLGGSEYAKSLIVQTDGKILVAGESSGQVIIARYLSSGAIDASFGFGTGKVTTTLPSADTTNYIALQADGKIVAVSRNFNNDIVVSRINQDGSIDNNFGFNGQVTTNLGGNESPKTLAVQSDGKILVAGWTDNGGTQIALVRYNTNGSLDISFGGGDGIVTTTPINGYTYSPYSTYNTNFNALNLAIQSDGKILVSGTIYNVSNANSDMVVMRYNPDGTLDSSFDSDGIVTTDINGNKNDYGNTLALQPDGNIVLGGYTNNGNNEDIAIIRLSNSSSSPIPDPSDPFTGTNGDDILPKNGADSSGDNTFYPLLGRDSVEGGLGIDLLVVDYSSYTYAGGPYIPGMSRDFANNSFRAYKDTFGNYDEVKFNNIERFHLIGTNSSDTLIGGSYQDILIGNGGDDLLDGWGNLVGVPGDIIDGGAGTDTLYSGYFASETNALVINNTGTTISLSNGGSIKNVERFPYLTTGSGNDSINFNIDYSEYINTGSGDDTINAGLGAADSVDGGTGIDLLIVDYSSNSYTGGGTSAAGMTRIFNNNYFQAYKNSSGGYDQVSFNNIERFHLIGTNSSDTLIGGSYQDILIGNGGDDLLDGWGNLVGVPGDIIDGGAGTDTLYSGYFASETNALVINNTGATITLSNGGSIKNVERFPYLTTGSGNDSINFNIDYSEYINTGSGDDTINAGLGAADSVDGGTGIDLLIVDYSSNSYTGGMYQGGIYNNHSSLRAYKDDLGNYDEVTFTNIESFHVIGTISKDYLSGGSYNDILIGNDGNDTLNGGVGTDTLIGGTGNDIYDVDHVADTVIELANEGTDTVYSTISYSLGSNIENLTLQSTSAINATGNELDNSLLGNSAANTLNGGAGNDNLNGGVGADTLIGSTGNDIYYVDHVADTVTELTNEGIDTVYSTISYSLGSNIENLTLQGTSAINATGNELDNTLLGNSAANTLKGGVGADTLMGGAGNDIYYVDHVADTVTELTNEGTDTVYSTISYSLGSHVEKLTLQGTSAINATGNELDNTLLGNSAANTLNGGAGNDNLNGGVGADTLMGGAGNDIYYVDHVADTVIELANEGTDTVYSTISYSLGSNIEKLTLQGTSAIDATGNELDNTLLGNSAANTLNGGAGNDTLNGGVGADTLMGGAGNDIYYVDNASDVVIEVINAGSDTVQSSVTWTLGDNLENLTLTGSLAINGTGNNFNNNITGNAANNILTGNEGNDILNGGLGADTLIGGVGNDTLSLGADSVIDTILYNFGDGIDTVNQFNRTGADKIGFTGIADIDVVVSGTTTSFRVGDGISGNAGFGIGAILVNLLNTTKFTADNINGNLAASNTANLWFV